MLKVKRGQSASGGRMVTAMAAGLLMLAACGGGDDPEAAADNSSTSTSDTTAGATSSTTTTAAQQAAQTTATTDDVRREWTNEAVTVWQNFLVSTGATIDVDGFFGRQSENATKVFQQQAGLPVTGIADPETLAAAGIDVQRAVFEKMTIITTTTTTERVALPDDPVVTLACPETETEAQSRYRATFSHTESYTTFASISIDYGDGKDFQSRLEESGLTGAFWHVYDTPGTFDVEVTIVDGEGREASATCSLTWAPS